jgi:predicted ATPase/class 3 adenylate cyclase
VTIGPMPQPSGTVTFLFTDIEGSTRLWVEHTAAMNRAVSRHDDLLRAVIDAHDGYVFSASGDGFAAAFASAAEAVATGLEGQAALLAERWDGLPDGIRVRMGLHLGASHERGGDYFGPEVNLAARVMSAAWGGQILCTDAVAALSPVDTASLGAHILRDVPGRIELHQLVEPALPSEFPAPRTVDAAPSTLPAQRSSFVGRRADVDAVRRLQLEHRLVTLTGPGGTGKTRLAIEVAGREAPRRPGGTYFADLASLDLSEHVAGAVAQACLVPPDSGRSPTDQLVDRLADRDALVVLDNCEHVLDAAADIADRLLVSCPKVAVLATSREALNLAGEHVHLVEPLDPAGADGRALFLERALAVGGSTADPTGATIDELCARVDGIPLAIELAAARTRALTPTQIVERLDERFSVLAGNRRGTPERHQTLRATIDWSYQLLDPDEQAFFAELAVFAGTFDLAAAASLVDHDLGRAADLLDGLVAKSMVATQGDAERGLRFHLLDTLRAFADERLWDQPERRGAAIAAHSQHYLARLAAMSLPEAMSRQIQTQCGPDLDNLRLAFARADGKPPDAEVTEALIRFVLQLANMGLIPEARQYGERALAAPDLTDLARGRLLAARSFMDATEDGSSGFAALAGEALKHLKPGDGTWSGALGLTSIPIQMFAPADIVPFLTQQRSRLDGLVNTDADVDRATVDFYLAGALMNLRRLGEATDVFVRSATVMNQVEPTNLIRLWSVAGAAIGQTLLGRPGEALGTLDQIADMVDWTDWAVEWAFAQALALAHRGPVEAGRTPLRAMAARLGSESPSPLAGTVVAGFGVLAAMEGRTARAATLFELLTATRSPASTAAAFEVLGRLEGWSDEEFANSKLERVIAAAVRQEAMTRADLFGRLNALAREEAEL